ncbi:MAG: VCBS repeat-containing protein [Saprospiraceae bacterium]|nr:VCBS repeat-containing protein [Candidatus Opimibacter skivensis]
MKVKWIILWCLLLSKLSAQPVSFTDHTNKLQYVFGTMGQAKCGVDMNGDGLDDITRISDEGLYIDFQKPDGTFLHRFVPLVVKALPVWSITAGDLDNDGLNDLVFGGNTNVSFVIAHQNGEAYTETIMPGFIFSQRGTLFDIDLDGDLDAFVCRDDGQSQTFRNTGSGNMELDQALFNTSTLPGNYSAIWTDYNNDGHTDLYLTKCLGGALPGNPARTNLLYRNNGNGTFTERGAEAGLNDNAQSWSTAFEDFDNDGDFDAFIINHDEGNRLMQNNGSGIFTNIINGSGIDEFDLGAWENASGDFNNDGYVDIISELQNELYLNNGDMTFTGQSLPFRPGAIGDFNNDGFLDVTYRSQLWTNDGNDNHWFKLMLRGIESNRNGIGARIELYGSWGVQTRELRSGQSYSPMNTLAIHFGIGQSETIDKLLVRWPGGEITEILNPAIDTTYNIAESPCIRTSELISVEGSTLLCPGDSIQLTAPVGYAAYLWSNGSTTSSLSVFSPGRHDVIVIDSMGCSGISQAVEIELADKNLPEIEIITGNATECQGSSVILKSTPGQHLLWSDGTMDTTAITVMSSGIYTVSIDSVCGQGKLISAPVEIIFLDASAPQIEGAAIVAGDSVLLNAAGENCLWFDAAIGGQLLNEGCDFQTMALYTDTTFYVESHYQYPGSIQAGGKPDTSGFNVLSPFAKEIHFTVTEPFTLVTTDMYLTNQMPEGERIIRLFSNQELVAETTAYLSNGKNVVTLNFQIAPGKYTLGCDRLDQYQNVGALDYPYPIGDVGQLDSSSMGLNFYPYFFNWQIQKEDITCVSARTPVPIEILTPNQDLNESPGIKIYPIPASDLLHISISKVQGMNGELIILDASGRLFEKHSYDHSSILSLPTNHFPSGVYQLILVSPQAAECKRFIIQQP